MIDINYVQLLVDAMASGAWPTGDEILDAIRSAHTPAQPRFVWFMDVDNHPVFVRTDAVVRIRKGQCIHESRTTLSPTTMIMCIDGNEFAVLGNIEDVLARVEGRVA